MAFSYQRWLVCGAVALVAGCASSGITDYDDGGFNAGLDADGSSELDAAEDPPDAEAERDASTLDSGTPDADLPDPEPDPADASGDASPKPDATAPAPDAQGPDGNVCTDGDGDGTCDFADNCPAVANAGQTDTDGDGVGDACDTTPEPCAAQKPPSSVSTGDDAQLSAVRINGGENTATVVASAKVSLELAYAFDDCGFLSRDDERFIVAGFEDDREGTCTALSAPCPNEASGSVTLSIDAPATPGTYFIVATGEQNRNCSGSLDRSERIAALCVR